MIPPGGSAEEDHRAQKGPALGYSAKEQFGNAFILSKGKEEKKTKEVSIS